MDLNDTRQIPMWMASPALPVVVGVVLFIALGVIAVSERAAEESIEDGPVAVAGSLPGEATRRPPVAPPTRVDSPGLLAAKTVRKLSRRGEFLEALKVLRALAPEDRKAMGTSEFEGQERRLLQAAGERLLIRIKPLEPDEAILKLKSFLDLDGVEGHPVEETVRGRLGELTKEAD